jgi:uncharacterized membrane protein
MRSAGEFVKTCIVGGFFGVLPILLIVLLIVQALGLIGGVAHPIVEQLPVEQLGGVEVATLVALLLILAACFLAGALLRTRFGSWSVDWLERTVLVPNAPTPTVGTICYLPRERVQRLAVPLGTAVNCIMQWGIGSEELIRARA